MRIIYGSYSHVENESRLRGFNITDDDPNAQRFMTNTNRKKNQEMNKVVLV